MPLPSYLQFRQPPNLLAQASTPRPTVPASAPRVPALPTASGTSEVYLVGGVLRSKGSHDQSAHHFYTSAARVARDRAAALKKTGSPDKVTVIMYEPAYEVRATNDKKTDPVTGKLDPQYHRKIMETAAKRDGYEAKFVRSHHEMDNEMAKISTQTPIKNGGYFGHSDKDDFFLDYGEHAPGSGSEDVATKYLSAGDLKAAGVKFHPDAHFASYGCSQGDAGGMMEQLSKDHNIKTTGSDGKSEYESVGRGYSIPRSTNGYTSYQNGKSIPPLVKAPPPPPPKP
ncbi:MAG: hypothetical protein JWR15_3853 [Prosthecobacter sp.]|nr:hypothetical protein [Prosthecobacter sp.]